MGGCGDFTDRVDGLQKSEESEGLRIEWGRTYCKPMAQNRKPIMQFVGNNLRKSLERK